MKCEIRAAVSDYALDMHFPDETVTIYFNSRRNAENVKKIIETDKSVPNAATVCDMQEAVYCKDCRFLRFSDFYGECGCGLLGIVSPWDYCSHGEKGDVKTLANRLMAVIGETTDNCSRKDGDGE